VRARLDIGAIVELDGRRAILRRPGAEGPVAETGGTWFVRFLDSGEKDIRHVTPDDLVEVVGPALQRAEARKARQVARLRVVTAWACAIVVALFLALDPRGGPTAMFGLGVVLIVAPGCLVALALRGIVRGVRRASL